MMKAFAATIGWLGLLAATGVLLAGDETNRFHGASHDGYAWSAFYQNEGPSPDAINARFRGASRDGYDNGIIENTPVRVSGSTVIIVR